MKAIIILALLCAFSMQQTVLISSSAANTIITAPANYHSVVEAYHTSLNPNYIGYNAQWIYKNGSDAWPIGDAVTFVAYFYADCQQNATLIITADNSFSASLNGGAAVSGNSWFVKYRFTLSNLKCGVNTLTIRTVNQDAGSPAALIFAVVQDQSKCYACANSLSFYNKNTCKCQCLDHCNCASIRPRYIWSDYPVCGCKCATVLKCPVNQYFNAQTCACQCNPIACLPGYVQNQSSCQCVKRCVQNVLCTINHIWD